MLTLAHLALASMALASHNGVGQLPVMGWSGYNAFMQVCFNLYLLGIFLFPFSVFFVCAVTAVHYIYFCVSNMLSALHISTKNSGHCDKAGAGGYNETTFVQVFVFTSSQSIGVFCSSVCTASCRLPFCACFDTKSIQKYKQAFSIFASPSLPKFIRRCQYFSRPWKHSSRLDWIGKAMFT